MDSALYQKLLPYQVRARRRKKIVCAVSVLSVAVIVLTALCVTLPAITMATICGKEEHKHSQECWETVETAGSEQLICEIGTESDLLVLHTHDGFCFDHNGDLICALPEKTLHIHSNECYEEVPVEEAETEIVPESEDGAEEASSSQNNPVNIGDLLPNEPHTPTSHILKCSSEEIVLHTHTAECEGNSCTLMQVIEHQHSAECVCESEPQTESVLICFLEEHVHESACYPKKDTLCGSMEHSHGAACFDGADILICTMSEHIHSDDCALEKSTDEIETVEPASDAFEHVQEQIPVKVADPYASTETKDYSVAMLEKVSLTGNWAADVLSVAKSQLGYTESKTDCITNTYGQSKGYTYFGDYYGCPYDDWCAMFVSFCIERAGVVSFPTDASCSRWETVLRQDGLWQNAHSEEDEPIYIPTPGDLIFYDFDLNGNADHIGFVTDIKEASGDTPALIHTIEGNVSDMVCAVTHALDYECIIGYAALPENPEKTICITAETESGLLVTVSGPEESFPGPEALLKLEVRELNRDSATQEEAAVYRQVDDHLSVSEAAQIQLFDLTIYLDGELSQLTGIVTVTISEAINGSFDVYHVSSEIIEEISSDQNNPVAVVFQTTHFSFFGIVSNGEPQAAASVNSGETESASLTVRKQWNGSGTNHAPVTVTLYKNGVATNRTLTLNDGNNWVGVFDGLELPGEGEDFAYSVREDPVDGYYTDYGAIIQLQTVTEEAYWVPVSNNSLSNGGTYVFCTQFNGDYYTPASDLGANTIYMAALRVTRNGPITINGQTYQNYLSGVNDAAIFNAARHSSGAYLLSNNYTGKNINALGYCSVLPTSIQSGSNYLMQYQSGKLYSGTRYIRQSSANGEDNHDFTSGTSANASVFQLYERVAVTTTEHFYETTITNTYIEQHQGEGGGENSPEIHKTIDYLGDGTANPDTALSGDEFYRLYLDVHADGSSFYPADLLLVLDNSGSMFVGTPSSLIDGQLRNNVLNYVLLDLIPPFLAAHPENRVSIVYFSGPADEYVGFPAFLPANHTAGSVTNDAWVACNWTHSSTVATNSLLWDCHGRNGNIGTGTNYAQGLAQASQQLQNRNSTNSPHILFLSDGVPTYYVQANGLRGGNGFDSVGMSVMSSFYNKAVQNMNACRQPTRNAIQSFLNQYSDIPVSAVAFSPDMQGDRVSLMKEMPNAGGFFKYAWDTSSLAEAFSSFFHSASTSGVRITDQLSAYVELYGALPDYKVTMTEISTGNETVLYRNGAVTSAGNNIVDAVIFAPSGNVDSTGMVQVKFKSNYILDENYRYTFSFNVKVTQEAYDVYLNAGQQYPHIGDPNTDYGTNETSSEKPGLHSNKIAYVDYSVGGQDYTDFYVHPVVQVNANTVNLTICKNVIGTDTNAYFDFEIILKQSDGTPLTEIPSGSGYTVDVSTGKVSFRLRHGESVTICDLPEGVTAELTETEHAGYSVLIKEGTQTLAAGDFYAAILAEDRTITVINNAGAALPETGGPGTFIYISGGSVLILAALIYGWGRQKRESEKLLLH